MKKSPAVAGLVALFALSSPALAAHSPAISAALDRAVQVRQSNITPPGNWTTGYIPQPGGGKAYIQLARGDDDDQGQNDWIGANGG